MANDRITLRGALAGLKPDEAQRLGIYLVRGDEVIAQGGLDANGEVRINVAAKALAAREDNSLELVVGPAGLDAHLDHATDLVRTPINLEGIENGRLELPLKEIRLDQAILDRWWLWCRRYCVSGNVISPDGCPVPGAQVTVHTVAHTAGGYSKTARVTVTADQNGHFQTCFNWCRCRVCWPCWPCWPFWWRCWPWWWERDILHVIEHIEERLKTSSVIPHGPGPVEKAVLTLAQPAPHNLARGEAFPAAGNSGMSLAMAARASDMAISPNAERTTLIQRKLADARIRIYFPWWWWCCDDPNIVFTVTQGANTIVDEDPATQTRWCLEDDSTVTLVGNPQTVGSCPGDPKPLRGFAWTRVGNITVDTIHEGYANGFGGSAADLAFGGGLDIYGEFASAPPIGYYQVLAGQWGGNGNPARGGTTPVSPVPINADLFNHITILRSADGVTFTGADYFNIKMGPFTHPVSGMPNLYATQEQRASAPAPWPAFPALGPHDIVLWSFNGLKVSTASGNLIAGASSNGVDLGMEAFDSAGNPVALASNPADSLTLEIDNMDMTGHINSLTVRDSVGNNVPPTETGTCATYQVPPGGYVNLNVTVQDDNGHLMESYIRREMGHGLAADFGARGYADPVPGTFPPGPYQAPNTSLKSYVGGTEDIRYTPPESCCYDFQLWAAKRVTNGYGLIDNHERDFWTVSLRV